MMKIVSKAAKAAAQTQNRQATSAPVEVPYRRPKRNRSAAFPPPVRAAASRLTAVGYSTLKLRATMASTATITKTQTGIMAASRRNASLVSCPVPANRVITGLQRPTARESNNAETALPGSAADRSKTGCRPVQAAEHLIKDAVVTSQRTSVP